MDAAVVTKRTDITHSTNGSSAAASTSSSTWYYATFQVESGDRIELPIGGEDYGILAEGDFGKLTFQGTRYLGFERIR